MDPWVKRGPTQNGSLGNASRRSGVAPWQVSRTFRNPSGTPTWQERIAWVCERCHTPHHNYNCIKCRACRADRSSPIAPTGVDGKPKPWVKFSPPKVQDPRGGGGPPNRCKPAVPPDLIAARIARIAAGKKKATEGDADSAMPDATADPEKDEELKTLRTLLAKHAGKGLAGEVLAKIGGAEPEVDTQDTVTKARKTLNAAVQHEETCRARVEASLKILESARKVLEDAEAVHKERELDHEVAVEAKSEAYSEFKKEMESDEEDEEVLEVGDDGKALRKGVEALRVVIATPEKLAVELCDPQDDAGVNMQVLKALMDLKQLLQPVARPVINPIQIPKDRQDPHVRNPERERSPRRTGDAHAVKGDGSQASN